MSLQIFPGATINTAAIEAQVAAAKATADAAVQAAADALAADANTKQMIRNRDVTLTDLKATASQFGSVTAAADAIHAALEQELVAVRAALANVQTTPGTKGDPGANGASAYDVARAAGYGGTQTQWLASLKGTDGVSIKGDKGDVGPSGTANLALGVVPVPLVALNGNTTVVVPLAKTLTAVPTEVQVRHSAVVNLANVTLAVTAKTTSSVTVKVTSVGLAVAAGTLVVICF